MIENTHPKYASFDSKFLSVTFNKETGDIAFLGVEGSGRDRDKHASHNLLIPGYGAKAGSFKEDAPSRTEITDNYALFEKENGASVKYTMIDDKTMRVDLKKALTHDIFSTRLSIKTAPPTIWTKDEPENLPTINPLTIFKTKYEMPIYVHFPDFGTVEISSSSPDVYCLEDLQLSKDFSGIELGFKNYSFNHNRMHALHFGSSLLTFRLRKARKDPEKFDITFKVLDEQYPKFEAENDEKYNGLKRNWLNAFAQNRELFDMGDNIYFHGTGHLAIHMKADLLRVMDDDNEIFKIIRRVYEKQVSRTFKRCQAYDGEVSVCFFDKEKKDDKDFGCAVDSTPGAIIALTTGIAHWNFPLAKKLLRYATRAGDYLLSRDIDNDGIFEVPFAGDYMGQKCECGTQTNWWDNFSFGHKDIYFNYLCHRALRELSELLHRVGMHKRARRYERKLAKFDKRFFKTFYNPKTKLMAGWISRNGAVHDYGFTFAVSMGINEGLIPKEEGKRMLLLLLDEMKKAGYGDLRFGIPGNVWPVAQADTIDWPCMSDWGQYENGGLNGMNGYHFLTAMYNVGLTDEANKIFETILNTYEKDFTHSGLMPGYVRSVDWRTKEGVACGYNYLADNYYFLLSAFTGKEKRPHPSVVENN